MKLQFDQGAFVEDAAKRSREAADSATFAAETLEM
jgi:hypothetical protein